MLFRSKKSTIRSKAAQSREQGKAKEAKEKDVRTDGPA